MHSKNTVRNVVIVSVVGSILLAAAIGAFLWWYEGNEKDAAQKASDDMSAALVDNDASKAPDGAGDYVDGIRAYFGPIKAARTVDVRQVDNYSETENSASDRSWWTSTIFMRTERGAALLLVTFADTLDPRDAEVEAIRELSPRKAAGGSLSEDEAADAERGYASRGGKGATDIALSDPFFQQKARKPGGAPSPGPEPPSPEEIERQQRDAERQMERGRRRLKCVQDAQGDIEKLKRCSQS